MADDLPDLYELETIEQLRAISDDLRIRVIDLLKQQPMTVTQVGERLGIAPAKVHYHVRELERVGLLLLVETREKGGILEKYYRAIANDFHVPRSLLRSAPPDEVLAFASNTLNAMTSGLLRALENTLRNSESDDEPPITISDGSVYMTDGEIRNVMRQIQEQLKPFETPRGTEGERQHRVAYFAYPADEIQATEAGGARARDDAEVLPSKPNSRVVVLVGGVSYSRRELERVIEQGQRLNIYVLGHLAFARDVSADLADAAIATLRHKGTISATPEVRAVLKAKQRA